jgi:hypothetical protein
MCVMVDQFVSGSVNARIIIAVIPMACSLDCTTLLVALIPLQRMRASLKIVRLVHYVSLFFTTISCSGNTVDLSRLSYFYVGGDNVPGIIVLCTRFRFAGKTQKL